MKNKKMFFVVGMLFVLLLGGCSDAASVASYNISKDSDEFRVVRRVVFYNSITDTYMLEMTGNISINIDRTNVLEVTVKIGPDKYQKHYLGLSDNVTYTVEQLSVSDVSEYKYKVIFKPQSILPIELEYKSGEEALNKLENELK